MNAADIRALSLIQVRDAIAAGELTSVEVVSAAIEQARRFDAEYSLFMTFLPEAALEQAKAADQAFAEGKLLGPLHGVPFTIKDNIDYGGVRTSAGSKVLENRIAEQDATVVAKLKAAGGISLGQTKCHDLVGGWGFVSPWYGAYRNPWDSTRLAGGSSSGAAGCMGLRIGYLALGTDSGGSVRIPAALCGLVGLKATHGIISEAGLVPTGPWGQDHIGPLARTGADSQLVLSILQGYDPRDPDSATRLPTPYPAVTSLAGMKVGIPENYFWEGLDPEVERICLAAVEKIKEAGAEIVPVRFDTIGLLATLTAVTAAESYVYHEQYVKDFPEYYSEPRRYRLLSSQYILATDYVRAQRARRLVTEEFTKVLDSVDFLVTPGTHRTAHKIDDPNIPSPQAGGSIYARSTNPFNQTGVPAVTIPVALSSEGLPVGLHLATAAYEDAKMLQIAAYLESLFAFTAVPPVLREVPAMA
ncbi:MAG: amidase [Chloroflexi bacterium]|nr:amidase [Chloroflexota bacterium]